MLDFLSAIGDTLSAFLAFVLNILSGFLYLVSMIPKAFAVIGLSFGYMPAILVGFAAAGIAICIVYLLIGR